MFVHLALNAQLQRGLLRTSNLRLLEETLERRRAEQAVLAANEQLEQRVEERTRALEAANENCARKSHAASGWKKTCGSRKRFLQTIFDHVPVSINYLTKKGRIQMVNREWERLVGHTLDEVVHQGVDVIAEDYPRPRRAPAGARFRGELDFRMGRLQNDGQETVDIIDTTWAVVPSLRWCHASGSARISPSANRPSRSCENRRKFCKPSSIIFPS